MPRFFFHTADGKRDVDNHGVELPDRGTARKEAIRFAGDVLSDSPDLLWDGKDFRVEVVDEAGDLLFTVIMLAVDAPASAEPE